jgi:hypothetical protein
MTPEEYEGCLKRLRFAIQDLEKAKYLDAKGGPRRTQWAAERRESARVWALMIATALKDPHS